MLHLIEKISTYKVKQKDFHSKFYIKHLKLENEYSDTKSRFFFLFETES